MHDETRHCLHIHAAAVEHCRVAIDSISPVCRGPWPYSCESWTLTKYEETHLDTFEMKGLRKILRVSWVLNKARVKRELLDTVKARKLAYYGHTMRKQVSCLEKEIMQGTMPGTCTQARKAWMDNIKTWTELSVEESIRMTEDRDKWRKYVHGVANPWIEDG